MSASAAGAALAVVDMARNGQFAELCERFAPPLRPMVSADAVRAEWDGVLAQHGPVTGVGTPLTEPAGPGATTAKIPLTFDGGELVIAIGLAGEQNWIIGIQFLPAGAAEPAAPPPWPAARTSPSASTTPTTTSSSPAPALRRPPSTSRPSTWIPRSSPASRAGSRRAETVSLPKY